MRAVVGDSSGEEKPSAVVLECFAHHNAILFVIPKANCETSTLMDFNQTSVKLRGSSSRQPREHYEKSDTFLDSIRQEPEPELGHSEICEL